MMLVYGSLMKAVLSTMCLFTAAAGCWLGVMELVLRHPGFPQRIVIAALIVVQSVLTLVVIRSSHRLWRTLMSAGACGCLTLGALAIVRSVTGPHFEGFAVIIGLALIVQALLTLWTTVRGVRQQPVAVQVR